MATEVWPELTNIQDEDVLRKMWQETEDFGRKKEIRARMYKLREQRLKDFYTTGETQSEVSVRKSKTHTESIGDQGSFLTMKTKEIRDSESPTRDISCSKRGKTWTTSYSDNQTGARTGNTEIVSINQSIAPAESKELIETSSVTTGKTSQRVAQSSSVQTSKVSSQSVVQSSSSEVYTGGSTEVISGQKMDSVSNARQITSGTGGSVSASEYHVKGGSQTVTSESKTQQKGGQTVTTTKTVKHTSSGGPGEVVTTTYTTYDNSQPSQQTTTKVCGSNDRFQGGGIESDQNRSIINKTTTIVKSEPKISHSVSQSHSSSQQIQQSQSSTTHSSQSFSQSSMQKSIQERQDHSSVSNKVSQEHVSSNDQNKVSSQSSKTSDSQNYIVQDSSTNVAEHRAILDSKDNRAERNDRVQITEVGSYDLDQNISNSQKRKDTISNLNQEKLQHVDIVDSQRTVKAIDNVSRIQSSTKAQNEETSIKSSVSSTDQKIMNEIQKLDSYLSTQPTPSHSVPISPQSNMDSNWPVDKEFVYSDSTPRDNKIMVNGEKPTPIRHPNNLEVSKDATDGQYLTTYRHDYTPKVSKDHDSNHQYFASTLRASPDRSSPSPSKRSSSKGSLDRSTPDRKFRGSSPRKTPDPERRLSSSSYTIERISDSKRRTDANERSQTLPKDSNKPKRKLSSTQTKAANKTRVSTPGTSPTTSPSRVHRGRKPSISDSDSDHSNATFSKSTSSLKKNERQEIEKYGSTTRIRGSSTSVNITDNERPFSSPSPTRHPARENTPDYSSEGSITRELRTSRMSEKSLTTLDSSPERSAFSPIKSFRTSPERKDQTLNMINEERRALDTSTSIVSTSDTIYDTKISSDTQLKNITTNENKIRGIPDTSPKRHRDSPEKNYKINSNNINKSQQQTAHKKTTPSPDRSKKDKHPSKVAQRPLKSSPDRKMTPDRRSPVKQNRIDSKPERQSPSKSLYQSPGTPKQKVPSFSKQKPNYAGTEKTSVVQKTTKTHQGERITRRSSIPRAEVKNNFRLGRDSETNTKPHFTRDTTSSATRVSTTRMSLSPVSLQPKRSATKSIDRSSISNVKEIKHLAPKKSDIALKSTPKKPTKQSQPTYNKPLTGDSNRTKIPVGSPSVTNKKDDTSRKVPISKANEKTGVKKPEKDISPVKGKDLLITDHKQIVLDKESDNSIDDEQPPEFFDELIDRDETDHIVVEKNDSNNFILHETDRTSSCDVRSINKKLTDSKTSLEMTDNSSKFLLAEQLSLRTSKHVTSTQDTSSPNSSKQKDKPKDSSKPIKKKLSGHKVPKTSDLSSSSDEDEIVIHFDEHSDTKKTDSQQTKILKRDVSKQSQVSEKTKSNLKVVVGQPKSPRELSSEKSIPMSVTSDGGQTPRYADFITEPEDVEVFDSRNLGPNRPIPSTVLEENRIVEESDDTTRETEKVSVAERVTKYTEKTNKVDIVTLDTCKQQNIDSSDVLKTKELFESINKNNQEDTNTLERRGSKKYNEVDEFIQKESADTVKKGVKSTAVVTSTVHSSDSIDISQSTVTRKDSAQQQASKVQKPTPKKHPSAEDVLKKPERRLSEHSPDIESKKAFFEKKSKENVTDIIAPVSPSPDEPVKPDESDEKVPHYMMDTVTAATRKESIQREFAPVRQGTDTDLQYTNKEKRSSIDIEKIDLMKKSEISHVNKDTKTSTQSSERRRSSLEVQELDTFKKTEAYIVCDDRARRLSEKRSSIDLQMNITNTTVKKETSDTKLKSFHAKSPDRSPNRKISKEKPSERVPLKKKDTNIMSEERVSEIKTNKFGVALRKSSSGGASPTSKPKSSQPDIIPDQLPEIEEIFDLQILEILLTRAILYEERRRIRAQIRIVKKHLESEQNIPATRKPQSTQKNERGIKEDTYQRKDSTRVEKSAPKEKKRTPSPTKDSRIPDEGRKAVNRSSPERTVKTSLDRRESQKTYDSRRVSTDRNTVSVSTVRSYTSPDKKYSVKETKTETRRISSSSPDRKTTLESMIRKATPYPIMSSERKTSSSFESRVDSHSTYTRSSPERKKSQDDMTRRTDTFTRSPERRTSKPSPERKTSFETKKTSESSKTTFRSSPERKISKDQENRSYSSISEEKRSEVRKTSRTSPDRKISKDSSMRKTSDSKTYLRSSPERRLSSDITDMFKSSSQVLRTSTQYTTTSSSTLVGRKGEDSITSSYGVGPTDNQGRPLFGLRALRSSNRTPDETSDIELGEDVGDGLVDEIRGSDGRPLFGLKAIKTVTASTTSSTVISSDMPSTQHLVQKHQQFLSEVKSSEDKVKGEAPKARLRDSFILDNDETGNNVLPSLPQAQGVSLKSIIQKHEDMASNGKNVRREVQSTKTVVSSHGTLSSDGKVSVTKNMVHGELRGKDGAEPTGRITTSQYTYRTSDDPTQKPQISSTTSTTHLSGSQRNSIASLGEVRIEEYKESDSRRDSLVNFAKKSLENKQKDEGKQTDQTWQAEKKAVVRGDSIKALQHKFQQPTVSSSMKRVSGEEGRRTSVEERRSSVKEERVESRTSTTSITSSSTRRDSGTSVSSKQTTREGNKSVSSFLDDTSKVTGVQDILQRMRNADLVTESTDTTEDSEARSLLNKFLGASVILQGMEAGGAGPASSALVSQVERQRILTSTQRKTDDIDEITDEKQLQILLEACSDYDQRRKIRARLRKIMAERKGGQGELVGVEDGEERREEFSESRHFTSNDGGTFSRTEVQKTSTSSARLTKANSVQQSPFAKFRQLERQNSAPSGGVLFKMTDPKLVRSASTIKDRLLCWARAQTSGYKNVQIDNFSTSWSNGLAFCALIHHFFPDAFDFDTLTPESRRHNFELAFRIAEEKGNIYPLLDVEDMVAMRKPDWKCVFTYVQSIYRSMHNQPNAVKSF